ncbi:MAG: Flp pilus assembly complex ATPase component TadA [Phycisphaerales bacterium]|nr:Flp pilus assembly complex ATPase component TadA [Phycisphaerales bacterium]MCB9841606.1 Flp pilus assembly complex ATPase component TadA [Phycisphaeraceae bacterium]
MTPIDATLTLAQDAAPHAFGTLTLADALILMSFWKPILVLLPFVGWGWLISTIYDKHAHRFHLGRKQWNMVHLIAGLLAVVVFFAIPMKGEIAFWIALLAMMGVLLVDLIVFPMVANRDDRVPEAHRLRFDLSAMQEARAAKAAAKQAGKAELILTGPGKRKLEVPDTETPEFETRVLAESLYIKGREARASLVEVLPSGKPDGTYGVVYLVDGVRQAGDAFPGPQALSIMDVWKSAAGLDVADRRRKMLADVSVEYAGAKKTVRVLSQGTQGVMRLTLTFDPAESVRRAVDDLGLLDPQIEAVKRIAADGTGVVLASGQTRGGRTTTLYALTRLHDAYTSNVQTLELEIQDAIEGSKQNVFDPQNTEAEFSKTIRSILRRDPDVVAVAEVPDQQTAVEICKADHTRTRIYVSLRQSSALSTLQGWTKAVGDPDLATAGLRGVLAQRLIRRLCANCRVPYQPTPDMLKQLGLPADKVKQLFKKGGQVLIKNKPELCPVCNGGGYIGQEGLFEVYEITDAIRDMIRGGRWNDVKAEFRKSGLPSINQVALRKAVDGVTSVEEIARISQEGAAKAGAGA